MARSLVPLCLFVCALPAAAQQGVRIEGFAGRVETLSDSGRIELLTGLGPREYTGAGHLESGALSRARLSWTSQASLELSGRAGLEWSARGETALRAFELERAELEVRRGTLLLHWPGGWHARFGGGAFRLTARPGGALELETVAGAAPRVWSSDGASFRERRGPGPGERIVLGPDAPLPSDARPEPWQPWSSVSWPWGTAVAVEEPAPPPAPPPALEPALEPEAVPVQLAEPQRDETAQTAPPVRETLVLPRAACTPERAELPTPAASAEAAPRVEPAPESAPLAPPAPEPAPAPAILPAPPAAAYDPAQWGGLAREALLSCGPLAFEARPDLVLERTESGGIALRLRSDATRSAWVFRCERDLELLPGTLALFDPQGRLCAELGRVLERPVPAGRTAPARAGFPAAR